MSLNNMTDPEMAEFLKHLQDRVEVVLPDQTSYLIVLQPADGDSPLEHTHVLTTVNDRSRLVAWLREIADKVESKDGVEYDGFGPIFDDGEDFDGED